MYNREYYQMTDANMTEEYEADYNRAYARDTSYTYDNMARQYETYEEEEEVSEIQRKIRETRRREHYYEERARKSRLRRLEQSRGIGLGACAMLVATVVVMLYLCIDYISLNTQITSMSKEVVTKENQYNALKAKNDSRLKEVQSSIDLEDIYMTATRDLGMVYANKNQIITYQGSESAYVRQYEDLPQEYGDNIFDDIIEAIK